MNERAELLTAFVSTTEWKDAIRTPLAGDASRRRYTRLTDTAKSRSAILMDAPPALGEDVRPFLKVGAYLSALGLSAPDTYAADEQQGFLILEDLGDAVFDQVCAADPALEWPLYKAAAEVLAQIAQAAPVADVVDCADQMTDLSLTCYPWYAGGITGAPTDAAADACRAALEPLIASLGGGHQTILRDFHAQNLIWLPRRTGLKRVGLLDYQDAMLGHAPYDLVSLVNDARRDVTRGVREKTMAHFADMAGLDRTDLDRGAAICSAQRNLRILMIFARMSLHFGKPHYVDLIPRVWSHLMNDLDHPDLGQLRRVVHDTLPEPTPDILQVLRDKCGTVPML